MRKHDKTACLLTLSCFRNAYVYSILSVKSATFNIKLLSKVD
nr:MAG TPA: hypothetical protein [Caudoviricetes sp.]